MQLAKLPDWRMQFHKAIQESPRLDRALYDFRRRRSPEKFKEGYIQAALDRTPNDAHLYLEVGVYKGGSFHLIEAQRKVGVDPNPLLDMSNLSNTEVVIVQESDSFFASPQADELLRGGVSVALIDGLHEFSQAWRDVANAARHMRAAPHGTVTCGRS